LGWNFSDPGSWSGIKWSDDFENRRVVDIDFRGLKLSGKLDLSEFAELEELFVRGNQLTELDVTGCNALRILLAEWNHISDISTHEDLARLRFVDYRYNHLDLENSDVTDMIEKIDETTDGNRGNFYYQPQNIVVVDMDILDDIRDGGVTVSVLVPCDIAGSRTISIDPAKISPIPADSVDLNIHVQITSRGNQAPGIPANSIVILPRAEPGEFGFELSFEITEEELDDAGLNGDNISLFYIDKNSNVTDYGKIKRNRDGSVTVTISHASSYMLSECCADAACEVCNRPVCGEDDYECKLPSCCVCNDKCDNTQCKDCYPNSHCDCNQFCCLDCDPGSVKCSKHVCVPCGIVCNLCVCSSCERTDCGLSSCCSCNDKCDNTQCKDCYPDGCGDCNQFCCPDCDPGSEKCNKHVCVPCEIVCGLCVCTICERTDCNQPECPTCNPDCNDCGLLACKVCNPCVTCAGICGQSCDHRNCEKLVLCGTCANCRGDDCKCGLCTRIAEFPDAPVKGRLLGKAEPDIFDALEIVRYVIGIENVIEKCDITRAAAQITAKSISNDEITIFDALEIVRFVLGMENEIE
jgi:hypothetical protein